MFELGTDGPQVILVGVDGSDGSVRAAAYAAGMARRQGAELVVAFVLMTPPMTSWAPAVGGALIEGQAEEVLELERLVREGAEYAGIGIRLVTSRGDVFHELIRHASEERADAVVVGASTRMGPRLAGSVAVRLVKAGRWPVIVVP